jgi:anti-sigma factor RsiW
MADCKKLDPLVTPYVDDELGVTERAAVDAHLRICPPCHARVVVEQSVRDLLSVHKGALKHECAPAALRGRCAQAARQEAGGIARLKPRAADIDEGVRGDVARGFSRAGATLARTKPLALAASLVLVVAGAFLYGLTDRSNRVMAAELVADHVKCFGLNRLLHTQQEAAFVETAMASSFGWHVQLPDRAPQMGLELVGARPCLYGEGRVAHIMYRYNGHPVSVFMLPNTVRTSEVVDIMGHEAAIWPSAGRTFVLVAREPRAEVERIAAFVHAALR